jgi:hypothetical protein
MIYDRSGGMGMTSVIDYLEKFNRKERYHLVRWVTGGFRPSVGFRSSIGNATRLNIPSGAFVAMDYHLNWLHAAIHISGDADATAPYPNALIDDVTGARMVQGNQEDVDLLIAFEDASITHLVMVEAKADASWSNSQLDSKARRLEAIFRNAGQSIAPHFLLASPERPRFIRCQDWPGWMRSGDEPAWVKMSRPDNLEVVFRCDDAGKRSNAGAYWTMRPVPRHRMMDPAN